MSARNSFFSAPPCGADTRENPATPKTDAVGDSRLKNFLRGILLIGLVSVTACSHSSVSKQSYLSPPDHYRSTDRFENIAVDVSIGPGKFSDDFATIVAEEIIIYSQRVGIDAKQTSVASEDAQAHLVVELNRPQDSAIHLPWAYLVSAELHDGNGRVIDKADLYHNAGFSEGAMSAKQLAALIVDEMLLIWHPETIVGRNKPGSSERSFFALLQSKSLLSGPSGEHLLSWEAFPSQRLLEGASFSTEDVTDVEYELRLHPVAGRGARQATGALVYRAEGLEDPSHLLPFKIPVCGSFDWSVRAHFRLHGWPRVTEWSGRPYSRRIGNAEQTDRFSRGPELEHFRQGGVRVARASSRSFECAELLGNGSGWINSFRLTEADAAERGKGRPNPMLPRDSIGVIASVFKPCDAYNCSQKTQDRQLAELLRNSLSLALQGRSLSFTVVNIVDEIESSNSMPQKSLERETGATLLERLHASGSLNGLSESGYRFVVNLELNTRSLTRATRTVGADIAFGVQNSQPIVAQAQIAVFDLDSEEIVGEMKTESRSEKGWSLQILPFPLPFPLNPLSDPEAETVHEMANRLALLFAVVDSEIRWPDDMFDKLTEFDSKRYVSN